MKNAEEMTPAELIERLESDIIYDCHSFRAKVGRSHALREIARRGQNILPDLVAHLEKTHFKPTEPRVPVGLNEEVARAWTVTLAGIERDHHLTGGPEKLNDYAGWLAWAKSQIPVST